jgi:ABC-type Fe3+ transport system substrate-binding protein
MKIALTRTARLTSIAALALALVACGGPSDPTDDPTGAPSGGAPSDGNPSQQLIDAAKAEGTLTWYTTVPPAPYAALVDAFTKAYGISVEVNRQTTPTLQPLIQGEIQGNQIVADVIELGSPRVIQTFADNGWLVAHNATSLPVMASFPTDWIYKDAVFAQAIAPYGITFNKQLVNPAPTTWDVLIDPQYKGKISMIDPRVQSGGIEILRNLRAQYGDDFLRKLGQQELQFAASAVNQVNSVAAGDVSMSFNGIRWIDTDLISKGAPIDTAFPLPAMSGSEQWAAQVKGSPHPNAAALFLNFSLSEAGQIATCKDQCASVINAAGTVAFPPSYKSPETNVPDAEKAELIALIGL